MDVLFPTSSLQIVELLRNSSYLLSLCVDEEEQNLKNKIAFSAIEQLVEFYASCTQPLDEEGEIFVRDCIHYLYRTYPALPKTAIYYIMIKPDSSLEFGNTSFTINNVVFLNSKAVFHPEVVMHEALHVLQRCCAKWFGLFCEKLGYVAVERSSIQGCPSRSISNPDADVTYSNNKGEIVFYDANLKPMVFHVPTSTCESMNEEIIDFIGEQLRRDSISEMVAVRLTQEKYISKQKSVDMVNNILDLLPVEKDESLLVLLLALGLVLLF